MSSQPKWSLGSWAYEWNANGSLKKVKRPDGSVITFKYDAFGRRISKSYHRREFLYIWDGNVLLHEIKKDYQLEDQLTTWIFQDFVPVAKLQGDKSYSIISDHIGTPLVAIDNEGVKVWERELDIYGKVRKETKETPNFVPFRYQGQYYDSEVDLCYNRFRYYDCKTGSYISQDPIRLAGNNPTLYGYVKDTNMWVDISGLDSSKLNQALGGVKGDGMSAHHLIPETVYDKYQAFFSTLEIERDDRYNGLLMPSSQKKAVELGDVNMIVHLGGHPEYIKEVEKSVSKYSQDFNKGLMDKKEATDKIRELQNDLRIDIINKKKRVKSTPCGGANTLA